MGTLRVVWKQSSRPSQRKTWSSYVLSACRVTDSTGPCMVLSQRIW